MKSIFKLSLIAFLIPLLSWGNTDITKQEKSKQIKKSFTVDADAKVSIDNKFGTVKVTTWDQNRVEIDVTITVKGNDADEVEKRLNATDVYFENGSSYVNAKTVFGNKKGSWSMWGNKKRINYQIDYVVKLPVSNSVALSNDYGNIYLNTLDGNAAINCDYGNIIIGTLNGRENSINLDYSKSSSITSTKNVSINSDYSTLSIGKAENVSLNADYSTITLSSVQNVNYNTDYGNLNVNGGVALTGNSDYTNLNFEGIQKSITVKADYGSLKIRDLKKDFDSVIIDSDYVGISIETNSTDFDFELNLQYANFKQENSRNVEMVRSEKKSSRNYFKGRYGNGGNSKIIIKSGYGNVSINNQ